jgi:RNA polymerase sigma-70 factor (ECF subfamily)
MTDLAWINTALIAARPQAVGALLRYFRDMDRAEEAFQDACLRALKNWPEKGPPRDPTAWLILVGRNAGLDIVRKQSRNTQLPPDDEISDLGDAESELAERLDGSHYRDDVLRLLFICCHPELQPTQQIALALRIVSGLTVTQIARAFLVSEAAMEQRITRAKARIAKAEVPFETPGPVERAERLAAVAAMIYLLFNEGYSVGDDPARAHLCDEAIRLARLLLRLFRAGDHGADGPDAAEAGAAAGALRFWRRSHPAGRPGPGVVEYKFHRRRIGVDRQGDAPQPPRPLPGAGRHRRHP